MSGASRPSSAGQSACSGGGGTARASCGTSSCHMASGAVAADVDPGADRGPGPGVVGAPGQLRDQAGLADPGLPGEQDHAPVPGPRRRPGRHQRAQLGGPPEQRAGRHRAGRGRGGAGARSRGPRPAPRAATGRAGRRVPHAAGRSPPARRSGPRPGRRPRRAAEPGRRGPLRSADPARSAAATSAPPRRRRHRARRPRTGRPASRPAPLASRRRAVSAQSSAYPASSSPWHSDGRGGGVAGGGAALAVGQVDRDRLGAQPDRGPGGDQRVVADGLAQRPDRGAQVRPRGRPGGAGPQGGRHRLTVVRRPGARQGERAAGRLGGGSESCSPSRSAATPPSSRTCSTPSL